MASKEQERRRPVMESSAYLRREPITSPTAASLELTQANQYFHSKVKGFPTSIPSLMVDFDPSGLGAIGGAYYSDNQVGLCVPIPCGRIRTLHISKAGPVFDQGLLFVQRGTIAHEKWHHSQYLARFPTVGFYKDSKKRVFLDDLLDQESFTRAYVQEGGALFFGAAYECDLFHRKGEWSIISNYWLHDFLKSPFREKVAEGVIGIFSSGASPEVVPAIHKVVSDICLQGEKDGGRQCVDNQSHAAYPVGGIVALAVFAHNNFDVTQSLQDFLNFKKVLAILETDDHALKTAAKIGCVQLLPYSKFSKYLKNDEAMQMMGESICQRYGEEVMKDALRVAEAIGTQA
jgi:hypothetical protein